ncbi:MAG: MFS transporter [Patescibacteria group bacterium]
MATTKNISLWALYDFANSIIMIVFLFYFSQWVVIDSGKPDWWFNSTLIISSLIFVFTAPVAAQVIDRSKKRMPGLRLTTLIAALLYSGTALITLFWPSQVLLAVIFCTGALYFYLLCFVYYTPLIKDLSTSDNRSFISGIGQGANSLGQVLGLIFALPFATGMVYLFGEEGRIQALLPAVVAFVVLALPMLIWFKEEAGIPTEVSVLEEYKVVFSTLKKIFSVPNLALMFLAYFLFSDAYLTFGNNYPIFLQKVFGVSDTVKSLLTASILLLSVFSALVFGRIADRFGKKKTLLVILSSMSVFLVVLALSPSFTFAAIASLLCGLVYGPAYSVSRAMVADYAPEELSASSFSYYVLAERFATFIGPLLWSGILVGAVSYGATSYSFAILGMVVLIIISLPLVWKIQSR